MALALALASKYHGLGLGLGLEPAGLEPIPGGEQEDYKVKTDMLRSNGPGNPWSQSGKRKGRLRWEGFAEKESFKPGVEE